MSNQSLTVAGLRDSAVVPRALGEPCAPAEAGTAMCSRVASDV